MKCNFKLVLIFFFFYLKAVPFLLYTHLVQVLVVRNVHFTEARVRLSFHLVCIKCVREGTCHSKSPVPPALICLRTPAAFAFVTLRQKERDHFVTWGEKHSARNHCQPLSPQRPVISVFHLFCHHLQALPGLNLVTPGPTLSTTPAASWPSTIGKGLGFIPSRV